jgi:hypothetical protein
MTIHSNNEIKISDGTFEISSLDDVIHVDNNLTIDGGNINIKRSYEGLEAKDIIINDGSILITASDDGINVVNTINDTATLSIYEGTIKVNANGDGIDANGSVYVYGGKICVDGPTSDGDGALDYDKEFVIFGGTLVVLGSSGMAMGISNNSTQCGILVNLSKKYPVGDVITIINSKNEEILSYTANKSYSSICYSSNLLEKGKTYTLKINDEDIQDLTINSILTTSKTTNQGSLNNHNQRGSRR